MFFDELGLHYILEQYLFQFSRPPVKALNNFNSFFFTGMMLNEVVPEDEPFESLNGIALSKPELANIRNFAGWALFKEKRAAKANIDRAFGSSGKNAKRKISEEMNIIKIIDKLIIPREEALQRTEYPETLSHVEFHNRGGLAHVSDEVFQFFVQLEQCCKAKFKVEIIQKYQKDGLKFARDFVKGNDEMKLAWNAMAGNIFPKDTTEMGKCKDMTVKQMPVFGQLLQDILHCNIHCL